MFDHDKVLLGTFSQLETTLDAASPGPNSWDSCCGGKEIFIVALADSWQVGFWQVSCP